jgi:small subunit ribosomal protein S2
MHFGHLASRWHPKMHEYIFGVRGGVHIINLENTQKQLARALDDVKAIASRGGNVLFVGTKRQAQNIVEKYAVEAGMPYVNNRWLGGTMTNFSELHKLIKKYKDLKDKQAKGELRKYTKKEQLMISREIDDLEKKVGGISTLDKVPDALFIVDTRKEKTALREANVMGIKVFAIVDTNVDPSKVDYPIPANDDAVKSIELISSLISEAIQEGKNTSKTTQATKPLSKRVQDKKEDEDKKIPSDDVSIKKEAVEDVEDLDEEIHEKVVAEKNTIN